MNPAMQPPTDPLASPVEARLLLGKFLRECRTRTGLSQEAVARLIQDSSSGQKVAKRTVLRLEQGKANLSLLVAGELARLYRCSVQEFYDYLRMGQLSAQVPALKTAQAHRAAGNAAHDRDDLASALAHYLRMWTLAPDDATRCLARNNQGLLLWKMDWPDMAVRVLNRALGEPVAERPELRVQLCYNLAIAHQYLGELPQARWAITEARSASRAWLEPRAADAARRRRHILVCVLHTEGMIAVDTYARSQSREEARAYLTEADQCLSEALAQGQSLELEADVATITANLGLVAALRKEWDQARALLDEARDRARRLGRPRPICSALIHLGRTAYWRKDYVEARAAFEEARPLAEEARFADWRFVAYYYLRQLDQRQGAGEGARHWERRMEEVYPDVTGTLLELHQYATRPDGRKNPNP